MMEKEIIAKFKKIKLNQVIYPLIITIFIIIVIFLFISTTKFLSESLNKIFFLNEELLSSQLPKLDIENFNFVIQKLGIETSTTPQ